MDKHGDEATPLVHKSAEQSVNNDILSSKDPRYFSFHPEGTPSIRSVFSVVSTMAGAGVLGMPSAVEQSGWTGLAILLVVWVMTNYTGKILIKSMYAKKPRLKLKTYHHVGEAAFGKSGLYLTLGFQNATLLFVGTLFLILAGSNLKSLFDQYHVPHVPLSIKVYIAITAGAVLPFICLLKTMKEISVIAIFGMIATTFTVVVIIIFSALDRISPTPSHKWVNAESMPFAFVTFVFAFGGHNVFPTIQDTMKSPKQFNRMFDLSYLFILLLYLPPCIVGYWAFGSETKEIILDNLKEGVVPVIATVAITLHLFFTIPIVNNPLALWVEEVTGISTSKHEVPLRILSRSILLGIEAGIAIGLPLFGDVMAFIGASCVSATVFFLPCWFYMKLYWKKIKVWEIVWICLVLFVATVGSAIGLYSACISMYQDITHKTLTISSSMFYGIVGGVSGTGFICILLSIWLISRSVKNSQH